MPFDDVLDVSEWPVNLTEAAGSKGNLWLEAPSGQLALFKPNRFTNKGLEQGEDWAEYLAYLLAHYMAIPTAAVSMAVLQGEAGTRNGSISLDLITPKYKRLGWEMQNGSVLLQSNPGYQARRSDGSGRPPRDHTGHNLATIKECLSDAGPPMFWPDELDAHGTFAGYLMLDALIGNQDRHEENWGVLVAPTGDVTLAPSYDHGASLGFLETDARRLKLLASDDAMLQYAHNGRARKFEGRTTPLVTLAHQAFSELGTEVREGWLDRLSDLDGDRLDALIQAVPRMSDPARMFCKRLLVINRRRLLDVRD